MAKKLPAIQFYIGDWLKDPKLSMCSPMTRGVWMDFLCAMHELDRVGELKGTANQLARIGRCLPSDVVTAVAELRESGAADIVVEGEIYTLINRRMQREFKERNQSRKRVENHRKNTNVTLGNNNVTNPNPSLSTENKEDEDLKRKSNGNVTPPSSISSSSSGLKQSVGGSGSHARERETEPPTAAAHAPPKHPEESQPDYLLRKQLEFPHLDVQKVFADFSAKCRSGDYPRLKLTRPQFDKWLENEHPPMEAAETAADDDVYVNPQTGRPLGH